MRLLQWALTLIGFLVVWVLIYSLFGSTEPGEAWGPEDYGRVAWLVGWPAVGAVLLYRARKRSRRQQ